MGRRIIVKDIVDLSGMSFQTIKKRLYDASVEPLGEDGKSIVYDSVAALRAVFCPVTPTKDTEQDDKKAALIAEQWREKKRENDIAEGLVAPLSLLTDALTRVGTKIMAQLEALPLEMKRANPRLTGHDIQTAKKSIAKCCNAIAETNIDVE